MRLTAVEISKLLVKDILTAVKGKLTIPRPTRNKKSALTDYVAANLTPSLEESLNKLLTGGQKRKTLRAGAPGISAPAPSERDDEQLPARKASRPDTEDLGEPGDFLDLPSEPIQKSCYREFYEATSNAALKLVVCAVCGRERDHRPDKVSSLELKEIPLSSRLVPERPHPKHTLFDGMLLQPEGLTRCNGGGTVANVCDECMRDLRKQTEVPPRFSLANNLWVGAIPTGLSSLTFPEQLLIAHLYPRVYVFKLFPKSGGGATEGLQRGMRGNVSTYELNVHAMTKMVEGTLMPRPLSVLSSLIAITYIGAGQIPKKWLHSTFRVRRHHVSRALVWLKENNPKYYSDIVIGDRELDQLLEDDVPDEVLGVIRQSTDEGLVDQESSGYVRTEDIGDARDEGTDPLEQSDLHAPSQDTDDGSPDVIPLQVSGSVDCDLSNITANELMNWGLLNMWKDGREGPYAVRHSGQPASDFPTRNNADHCPADQHNFFEKVFPCLYPYGQGGLESARPIPLDLPEHIRWSLQYFDRRFRKHETFPFVVFGISQRRQALSSARIQMKGQVFEREARAISSVTAEKLEQAKSDEDHGLPISDEAIRVLRKHVHATAARVSGSDQSRYRLRSQIWSTSTILGPPSLWITINPSDLHDLITQVFAGEDIDMDKFMATLGPDKSKRAKNIADDPYAAAKFFHFMITTILETLFQVKVTAGRVKTKVGMGGP
ncbi:hypothetical protein BJ322DRAFT_1114276 [Thelephora terrestris]|uniref:Helitron helicase-like domain-containing protein n=1 Tax=Thelephora terrestris TaxID=56493 RepID=A0A9P6H371_9AGAM|nr:hypothetical protein BJ322DRAFT_1114276 [Thelephora terrestris]